MEEYSDTKFLINVVVAYLPADSDRLDSYSKTQEKDPTCSQLHKFCKTSWPDVCTMKSNLAPYWRERGQLMTVCNDLFLLDAWIVVPKEM